jgi:hypothetical protein
MRTPAELAFWVSLSFAAIYYIALGTLYMTDPYFRAQNSFVNLGLYGAAFSILNFLILFTTPFIAKCMITGGCYNLTTAFVLFSVITISLSVMLLIKQSTLARDSIDYQSFMCHEDGNYYDTSIEKCVASEEYHACTSNPKQIWYSGACADKAKVDSCFSAGKFYEHGACVE